MLKIKEYYVRKLNPQKEYEIQVPGSKSITNRALLLAALSNYRCCLTGVSFSDDTRGFLDCLIQLGFEVEIEEERCRVTITGTGGIIPRKKATIDVRSAGTAARFLTVVLAFAGGDYKLNASEQMQKRPMEPVLKILENMKVKFRYNNKKYHFPFEMSSPIMDEEQEKIITVDTGLSSQFASALLMASCLLPKGARIHMTGVRTEGSYIKMTLEMMKQFGIRVEREGTESTGYRIGHQKEWGLETYEIEPDVSAACYFYAMAPLLKTNVIVKGVHEDSLQGDIQFLHVLEKMGCEKEETPKGIRMKGREASLHGVDVSMKDFSDQVMTLAAIAPFADAPSTIRNIGHIHFQESDRIHAIVTELTRMGILCEEDMKIDGIRIEPGEVKDTRVNTYEDHRMAMAFTLPGLRTGKITILNPDCCRKTFENYFSVIDSLYHD